MQYEVVFFKGRNSLENVGEWRVLGEGMNREQDVQLLAVRQIRGY